MRCDRCNRLCQDNPASVPRLTEVTIKGRRAVFCDECGRNVSAIHEVTDPKVVAEIDRPQQEGDEDADADEDGDSGGEEGEDEGSGDQGEEAEVKPDNADSEFTPKEEAPATPAPRRRKRRK